MLVCVNNAVYHQVPHLHQLVPGEVMERGCRENAVVELVLVTLLHHE